MFFDELFSETVDRGLLSGPGETERRVDAIAQRNG